MAVITDKDKVNAFLDRGIITQVLPGIEELRNRLLSGEKLRAYWGFDATSTALHLSHAKNFMLLEEFRQLGHEVIILFGDFTARIGDPTEKETARKQLSKEEVIANVHEWMLQIKPLLDFDTKENPPQVLYNSEWLAKLTLEDVVSLASNFTVQQMLERDMFAKRMKEEKPIHLHEFLYPLMQGYDSVAMEVDIEFCGTDQIFNALAGRTLLRRLKNKEKFVVAVNLLENPKTGDLMSKSKGTGVFLGTSAQDMYGSIMAQPDEMIRPFFINLTRLPIDEIDLLLKKSTGIESKKKVAFEVTSLLYGGVSAQKAQEEFSAIFSEKGVPDNMPEFSAGDEGITVVDALLESKLVASKTEAKRLIGDGAVSIEGRKVETWDTKVLKGTILKIGAHRFLKIV